MARSRRLSGFAVGLAAAVALGAAWRAILLLGPRAPALDADEAIVGLMARHLLRGGELPFFYYGQHYLGALEAWCAAVAFALFGESEVVLRSVPLVFSLVAIAGVGILGARSVSPRAGLIAALLFAVPPSGLAIWSLKARGGFIELVAIGTGALIAAERLFFANGGARAAAWLGGLLALGWWVNQQIVYYAVPIALFAAVRARTDEIVKGWVPPLALGALAAMRILPIERPPTIGGRLLLGVVTLSLLLAAARGLRRLGAGRSVWALPAAALLAAIADDLPILRASPLLEAVLVVAALALVTGSSIAGARPVAAAATAGTAAIGIGVLGWWNPRAPAYALVPLLVLVPRLLREVAARPVLRAFALGAAIGALPFAFALARHGLAVFDVLRGTGARGVAANLAGFFETSLPMLLGARPFWGDLDFAAGLSLALVLLYATSLPAFLAAAGSRAPFLATFLAGVPLVFAASGFGWFAREPRYLLPIYSVLFLVPAAAADRALDRGRTVLGALLIATLVGVHAWGLFAPRLATNEGFQLTAHERVARDHHELIAFLRERGIEHVYTNYWVGYRLAFESGESIVPTSFEQPATERIPAYGRAVRGAERVAYVAPPSRARLLERAVGGLGLSYERARVNGYEVVFDLERPGDDGPVRPLVLRREALRASASAHGLAALLDGDLSTRWATHAPQRPGQWLELRFDRPVDLAWISLSAGDYRLDHPRDLDVLARGEDGTWTTVASSSRDPGLAYWLQGGRLEIDARGARADRLRFVQTGADSVFDWSVAEVRVWEEDRR